MICLNSLLIRTTLISLLYFVSLSSSSYIPSCSSQKSVSFTPFEKAQYSSSFHSSNAATRIHESSRQTPVLQRDAIPNILNSKSSSSPSDSSSKINPQQTNKGKGIGSYYSSYPEPKRVSFESRQGSKDEKLVFSDNFDELDVEVWNHEITAGGGGNWEFEYYTNNRSNSYVRDSILYIKPTLTSDFIGDEKHLSDGTQLDLWGSAPADVCTGNAFYGCSRIGGAGGNIINPIQSARIRTSNSFSFKYGRVEVSARLPCGDWLWPAIWLLPTHNQYGKWPSSGEIDLVESRGNLKLDYTLPDGKSKIKGCDTMSSTIHFGPNWQSDPWNLTIATYTIPEGNLHDNFHVYGMKWTNETIYTYIDSEENKIMEVKIDQSFWSRGGWQKNDESKIPPFYDNPWADRPINAPFDQKFYLIMNLAVGGTNNYWPDELPGKSWKMKSEHAVNDFWKSKDEWSKTWIGEDAALQVDWVKIWQ